MKETHSMPTDPVDLWDRVNSDPYLRAKFEALIEMKRVLEDKSLEANNLGIAADNLDRYVAGLETRSRMARMRLRASKRKLYAFYFTHPILAVKSFLDRK